MTDVELAEIEKACSAATPGPWENAGEGLVNAEDQTVAEDTEKADATFIAGARTWVPMLLEEVRVLREMLGHKDRRLDRFYRENSCAHDWCDTGGNGRTCRRCARHEIHGTYR